MIYVADLETTTDPDDCRVWEWGIMPLDDGSFYYKGLDLLSVMQKMFDLAPCVIYFHNLKFDGTFIISWLLMNGWEHVSMKLNKSGKYQKVKLKENQFKCVISDMNQYYKIAIWTPNGILEIKDSLKLIPLPIAAFPKTFGFPEAKGEIDYDAPRDIGYQPTLEEWDYLEHDLNILRVGLNHMFELGLDKLTIGATALADFKENFGKKRYEMLFPRLDEAIDKALRPAYKGGYCYVKESVRGKTVGAGMVVDRNSMYPTVMKEKPYPVGQPVYFKGKFEEDNDYPLYVQRLICRFQLREGYLPTIQDKSSGLFAPTEYLKSNEWMDENGYPVDEPMVLTLTCIDLALFLEHYEVFDIEYCDGWKFQQMYHLFDDYIDYWYKLKEDAAREGNLGIKQCAKLMLNNLYGKFATRIIGSMKVPVLEDGVVKLKIIEPEKKDPVYLPVGIFVTAYARDCIIRLGQLNYDRLLYIDTDSLHVLGNIIYGVEIDKYKLGAWDIETEFVRARFLRAKSYIEEKVTCSKDDKKECKDQTQCAGCRKRLNIKCAGMPSSCHKHVTFDNFRVHSVFEGKLAATNVKGGQVLKPTIFTIKA